MTIFQRASRISERLGRQVWIWWDGSYHATVAFHPAPRRVFLARVIGGEIVR